jgi:DNA repair protein RecN (Recombination protein N)
VLCITHLPQIAARASTQFVIDKSVHGGRTVTRIVRLEGEARIDELARMVGGDNVTEAVRASARDLVASAGAKGKQKAKGESESQRRG